ncbi:hypothetical protein L0663_16705 [Dyadobacter sp. CY107]|uniref:hypothetical protein n=1 Tax=Dyadobacter fanqingshengii TaxID=2906443 RepID=UPI001F2DF983|nr:hypothetical protein [Dyadobacter fanqingshengii]MCF2505039.1 hypothetical protein [Dyadobacter fanqingshengii]
MKKRQMFFEMGLLLISILYGFGVIGSMYPGGGISKANIVKKATVVELEKRVQLRPEDLPEKVRNALNSKSYAGWTISDAYLVIADDGGEYYELVVRKADEQSRMKVNKNGQVLN